MKYILIIIILFSTLSCSLNKVKNNHGVLSLENKISKIKIDKSNTNDIINIFGPPSTKSSFDNNVWIYIERKVTNSSVFSIGAEKVSSNNLLVLKINGRGILYEMELYDLEKMNDIKISKLETQNTFKGSDFLTNILISVRQKINDPIRNRIKKRK